MAEPPLQFIPAHVFQAPDLIAQLQTREALFGRLGPGSGRRDGGLKSIHFAPDSLPEELDSGHPSSPAEKGF